MSKFTVGDTVKVLVCTDKRKLEGTIQTVVESVVESRNRGWTIVTCPGGWEGGKWGIPTENLQLVTTAHNNKLTTKKHFLEVDYET